MTDAPACPTCESRNSGEAFQKGGYAFRRCPDCKCLFVAGELESQAVYAHYSEAHYESDESTSEERHGYPSYRGARESFSQGFAMRVDLIRQYVQSGSLLEAGAAYGFFLKAAEPHFEVAGLEVSAYAAEVARRETGVPVAHGSIEEADFPDHRFDVVVMWDVIEHLMRPVLHGAGGDHSLRRVVPERRPQVDRGLVRPDLAGSPADSRLATGAVRRGDPLAGLR